MENRRYFRRIKFEADARIICNDTEYTAELLDIALKGALLRTQPALPLTIGDNCQLKIYLPASDITLHFEAEVVHESDNNYGFTFLAEDIDTITHLRRLLELNIGSAEEVDREILFWIKQ